MIKFLLRLWWMQQRRNFTWKDMVIGGYIVLIYILVGVGFYLGAEDDGNVLEAGLLTGVASTVFVAIFLVPDMILKLVMKRDVTAMDDYIKSRPIPESSWNKFLLLTNLASFWNYVIPVLLLPLLLYTMPCGQALVTFLLVLGYSLLDGMVITAHRKATGFWTRVPLWAGWVSLFLILCLFAFLSTFMTVGSANLVVLILAIVAFAAVCGYLFSIKNYNEHKQKSTSVHNFGRTTLFTMQLMGVLRAKRIRNMVLVVTLVYFFNAYLMALMPAEEDVSFQDSSLVLYVVGAIMLPSLVLSQWTFGIEANFFHGLMSKPVTVRQLLQNCYYFYLLVSAAATVLSLPFLFLTDTITLPILLGGYAMSVFVNLCNMPTALFSSRLDIFAGSMFNYQGANMKINLYAIAFVIPIGLLVAVYHFFGAMAWTVSSILLALLSIAIHKRVLDKVALIFNARKYQRMEKFME